MNDFYAREFWRFVSVQQSVAALAETAIQYPPMQAPAWRGVAGLVGIEGGVVSGVINLESSGVDAPDWRPRHDEHYHEA
jgi:hypothetical protein